MLNEKEREAAFPVHIDLGHKAPEMAVPGDSKRSDTKERVYYPTLYIEGVKGLEQLPKEGCILIEFRRKRLSIEEREDEQETAGVTLEVRALCLPEDFPEQAEEDLETSFRRFAQKSTAAEEEETEEEE